MTFQVITVKEAAERLDCCTKTVYKLINNETLKATKIPGVGIRINERDLHAVYDQNKIEHKGLMN